MIYDVAVVGLGPAGGLAACHLARAGLQVLALDRAPLPRDKPCGGALSLRAVRLLDFPMEVAVATLSAVTFTRGFGRAVPIASPAPFALMTHRAEFDHALARRAAAAGAVIRAGERLTRAWAGPEGLGLETSRGSYRARFLLGADGARSTTAALLRFPVSKQFTRSFEACTRPVRRYEEVAGIEFGHVPAGYAWVFPKGASASVGVMSPALHTTALGEAFVAALRGYGLDSAGVRRQGALIPHLRSPARSLRQGRALLAGDAAGLADAFLGEGIFYALRSGRLAATAIMRACLEGEEALDAYPQAVARELLPDLRSAAWLARLVYRLPGLWYRILERVPWGIEAYLGVLRGERDYPGLLRLMGREALRLIRRRGSGR